MAQLGPRFSGSGDATLASDGTVAQNPPASEDAGFIPGREEPLEREMASRSSILAWEIPLTEEPGGLQSTGSQSQLCLTRALRLHTHTRVCLTTCSAVLL